MAISLKLRVCDLRSKFIAYAFIFFPTLKPARAVSVFGFKPRLDVIDDLFVFVQPYRHLLHLFS